MEQDQRGFAASTVVRPIRFVLPPLQIPSYTSQSTRVPANIQVFVLSYTPAHARPTQILLPSSRLAAAVAKALAALEADERVPAVADASSTSH